jgi:hypothetical protein
VVVTLAVVLGVGTVTVAIVPSPKVKLKATMFAVPVAVALNVTGEPTVAGLEAVNAVTTGAAADAVPAAPGAMLIRPPASKASTAATATAKPCRLRDD